MNAAPATSASCLGKPPARECRERWEWLGAWGVWAAMFGGALLFVYRFGNTMPWADDYLLLAEDNRSRVAWLWAQHAEHRVPLAKLVWLTVLDLTGYDFRAGSFLTVLALAAVAGAMIRAARHLRGRASLLDAFFPLALFNFGQYHLYTWWWMINQTLAPLAACVLLLLLARNARPRPWDAVLIGAVLALSALCGPGGLPYALALGPWLAAWTILEGGVGRGVRLAVMVLAAAAVVLVGAYFIGFDRNSYFGRGLDSAASLTGALQVLSVSLGPATRPYWLYWGLSVVLLCAASTLLLLWTGWSRPGECWRVTGLGLFMAATVGLAVSVGWARAGMGEDYILSGHFLTKALPALFCAYLLWGLYGGRAARLVQGGLLLAAACLFYPNLSYGILGATSTRDTCRTMEQDLQAGTTPFRLAARHAASLGFGVEAAVPLFENLRQLGAGPFRVLNADSPRQLVPVPIVLVAASEMTRKEGAWEGEGAGAYLILGLGEPRFVHGVQVKVRLPKIIPSPALSFSLDWRNSAQNEFSPERRCVDTLLPSYSPNGETLTFGVFDTVDQIGFSLLDRPCVFEIVEIALLVAGPEDGIAQ